MNHHITTGFLGWLNPFDSDKGDVGPVDAVLTMDEKTGFSTWVLLGGGRQIGSSD